MKFLLIYFNSFATGKVLEIFSIARERERGRKSKLLESKHRTSNSRKTQYPVKVAFRRVSDDLSIFRSVARAKSILSMAPLPRIQQQLAAGAQQKTFAKGQNTAQEYPYRNYSCLLLLCVDFVVEAFACELGFLFFFGGLTNFH